MIRSVGLMSGTSVDGVDAALIETDGQWQVRALTHVFLPYTNPLKLALQALMYAVRSFSGSLTAASFHFSTQLRAYLQDALGFPQPVVMEQIDAICQYFKTDRLSAEQVIQASTRIHMEAVEALLIRADCAASQVDLIGYHGQTLFHKPSLSKSIIVGYPSQIANHFNCPVVADFRSNDIALGGQGAPLAPLYHQALAVRDNRVPCAVVNCGGIANLSLIKGPNQTDLLGFDTGPGNGLIDRFIRQRSQGRETMDRDGHYGLNGVVHEPLLAMLFDRAIQMQSSANYFLQPPPKSLDIGDLQLIPELERLSIQDGAATLEAFTARTIVQSLLTMRETLPQQWILAGGGWQNPVIRRELTQALIQHRGEAVRVETADEIGWNSQAMEAQLFAYLAVRSIQNQALTLPLTTGVAVPSSGGALFVPNLRATDPMFQ